MARRRPRLLRRLPSIHFWIFFLVASCFPGTSSSSSSAVRLLIRLLFLLLNLSLVIRLFVVDLCCDWDALSWLPTPFLWIPTVDVAPTEFLQHSSLDHSFSFCGVSNQLCRLADVALHALTDALLGTIAAGDIGWHFPPSDPQWRGAESRQFLRHAASLVTARGGRIGFVDLTIICEAPKIGPHRDAIRGRVAELLGISTDRVSVKATTTERLGFAGRGEGIAAQAAATVYLPGSFA